MATEYTEGEEGLDRPTLFRDKWLWFILLGNVLILAGIAAILVPAVSEVAASKVLGGVLAVSGVVQILQASGMASWRGFMWHMLLGVLAVIGGVLIYMNPLAGVVALTVSIAIVFGFHGATQLTFAMKVRGQPGWRWFLVSGLIALLVSVLLLMKLPYSRSFTPATVAGVSLLFAGWAYVAMALASHRARAG